MRSPGLMGFMGWFLRLTAEKLTIARTGYSRLMTCLEFEILLNMIRPLLRRLRLLAIEAWIPVLEHLERGQGESGAASLDDPNSAFALKPDEAWQNNHFSLPSAFRIWIAQDFLI
jgi:hypothetical protein